MESREDSQDRIWIETFATVRQDVRPGVETRPHRGRTRPFLICPIPRPFPISDAIEYEFYKCDIIVIYMP